MTLLGTRVIGALLAVALVFHLLAAPALAACSGEAAAKASEAARRIDGWSGLFEYYKQHLACDDGPAGESVDNAVESLLLKKWEGLPEAARQAAADPKYQKFLLRHVGEGFSEEGAAEIIKRSRAKCPAGAEKLCGALIDVLQE
ncbi:MAG: hypothetical protein ACOZEN_07265 [Thermodesulfobacteriota bacterium]